MDVKRYMILEYEEDFSKLPNNRNKAKLDNSEYYFTGRKCKRGHLKKRRTCNGLCLECDNINRANRKDDIIKERKKSYLKNKDKHYIRAKNWVSKNKDKSKLIKARYRDAHREELREKARKYIKHRRQDVFYRLSKNTSKAIWSFMNGSKGFRHWEDVIGYKFEELKNHLEFQFDASMSWDNYGDYWNIDHIIPLEFFMQLELDINAKIKKAWGLQNLRPLEIDINASKNCKIIKSLCSKICEALKIDFQLIELFAEKHGEFEYTNQKAQERLDKIEENK